MIFPVIVILVALLQLQNYFSSPIIRSIPAGLILLMNAYYSFKTPNFRISKSIAANPLVWVLALLVVVSLFRTNEPDSSAAFTYNRILMFFFLLTGVSYVFHYSTSRGMSFVDNIVNFIILPFMLLAIINLALWLLGIRVTQNVIAEDNGDSQAVLLSYFGISIQRVQFPLAGGFNNYAAILGGILVLSSTCVFILKQRRLITGVASSIFLFSLLLIDSRSAIILPVIILVLFFIIKNNTAVKWLKWMPMVFVLGPFLLMSLLPLLANIPFFSEIGRSREDLLTGNSRFVIWGIAFSEFLNFKMVHLIGFGEFGHFGSGASKLWAMIFNTWENSEMKSPHSTLLIILFDYGYLGVIVYTLLFFRLISRSINRWHDSRRESILVLSFFLYNLLAGITESLMGFYFPNYILLLFLVMTMEGNYRLLGRDSRLTQ